MASIPRYAMLVRKGSRAVLLLLLGVTLGITGPPRLMAHLKTRDRRLRVHAIDTHQGLGRWYLSTRLKGRFGLAKRTTVQRFP